MDERWFGGISFCSKNLFLKILNKLLTTEIVWCIIWTVEAVCGLSLEFFLWVLHINYIVWSPAGLAHPVERHLAKVEVASSSLVTRSILCVGASLLLC